MKEASQVHDLHFSGFFKARVVNNVDDSGEGMLGLFIPSIMTELSNMTEEPTPKTHVISEPIFENHGDHQVSPQIKIDNYIWARPCAFLVENGSGSNGSGGRFRIPKNGSMVTVYFENEDPNRPYWMPFTSTVEGDAISGREIGKGMNLANSSANWTDPAKKVNIDVIAEYDDGSVIVVDKNANSNSFALRWANGHTLSICHSSESGIYLETQKGHIVYLDENSGEIRVRTHSGKAKITLSDSGDITGYAESNITLNSAGSANVTAKGELLVKSESSVAVKAPSISLGA